jgi:hypothetical protein
MTLSKQFRLFPKCREERAAALHRTRIATGKLSQVGQVASAVVGHGMMFQLAPDVFDWIQLWGISRQILQGDVSVQTIDVLLYQARSMRLQAVPDNQQLLSDRAVQRFEELNDLRAFDRAREESKVEAPVTDTGNDRQLLPRKAVLENWCLTLGGPGTCATGSFGTLSVRSRGVDIPYVTDRSWPGCRRLRAQVRATGGTAANGQNRPGGNARQRQPFMPRKPAAHAGLSRLSG